MPERLQGSIDRATRHGVSGWVRRADTPDAGVVLHVAVDGRPVARVTADRYRADLERVGIGTGRHAFECRFPRALATDRRHRITVRLEPDGEHAPGSPVWIEAAGAFDERLKRAVARAVDAVASAEERQSVGEFLAQQARRLDPGGSDLRAGRPLAIIVDEFAPDPTRHAGAVAIMAHMRSLARLGWSVGLTAAGAPPDRRALAALTDNGIAWLGWPAYGSIEEMLRRLGPSAGLIYLYRGPSADAYLGLVRRHCPAARLLYGVCDLHHLRLERQAGISGDPDLLRDSRRMKKIEFAAGRRADAVITHSTFETDLLRQAVPQTPVHTIPWSLVPAPPRADFGRRRSIAFVGGFDHAPNADAVSWIGREILPALRAVRPDLECLVVGSNPPDSLRRAPPPGMRILGPVDDLRAVLQEVRLTVAPLRFGAGLKGKVLDSLAAGLPCVLTTVAAEGIPLPPLLRRLVADEVARIVARILRLHDDEAANRMVSAAGLDLIREHYSEDAVDAAMRVAAGAPAAIVPAPAHF